MTAPDTQAAAVAPASAWWQRARRLLGQWPSQCLVCQHWPSDWLCPACASACWQAQQRRCTRCALPLPTNSDICGACLRNPPWLRRCHAAVDYSPPWSGMVQQLKFHQHLAWASRMAQLLVQTPGVLANLQEASLILPVPLSASRLRERGYNQALLLAQALPQQASNHLPTNSKPLARVEPHALLRQLDTSAQAGLDRRARQRNLRRAFAVAPAWEPAIAGQQVLLVDDVMTTGATLDALARLLLQHGATAVDAVVFARTGAPGE